MPRPHLALPGTGKLVSGFAREEKAVLLEPNALQNCALRERLDGGLGPIHAARRLHAHKRGRCARIAGPLPRAPLPRRVPRACGSAPQLPVGRRRAAAAPRAALPAPPMNPASAADAPVTSPPATMAAPPPAAAVAAAATNHLVQAAEVFLAAEAIQSDAQSAAGAGPLFCPLGACASTFPDRHGFEEHMKAVHPDMYQVLCFKAPPATAYVTSRRTDKRAKTTPKKRPMVASSRAGKGGEEEE